MASIQLEGIVQAVSPQLTSGTFTFVTAVILIDHQTQYPQNIEVQFSGNQMSLAASLAPGQLYIFDLNIRGSKQPVVSKQHQNTYTAFNNLSVWKVTPAQQQAAQPQGNYNQPAQQFGQPQQQFGQPAQQGSFVGQPQGQPQTFGQPQQGQPTQPAQQFGNTPSQPTQQNFGNSGAAQPFGTPNGGGFPQGGGQA